MESDDRLDLDAALARWRASSAFDPETLAELEAHLRDAISEGIADGLSPSQAFREALAQLGDAAQLAGEFSKLPPSTKSKTMNTSLLQSPRLRRVARQLLLAAVIVIPIRAFAIAPYRAAGASVTPEIPEGAHVLAWRIAPKFAPGDVAVYREGDHTFLGRVTVVNADGITIARNDQIVRSVPREAVIGRVILTTR